MHFMHFCDIDLRIDKIILLYTSSYIFECKDTTKFFINQSRLYSTLF